MKMKLSEIVITATTTTKELKEIYRDHEQELSQRLLTQMIRHVNADSRLLSWVSKRDDLGEDLIEILFFKKKHMSFEDRWNFLQKLKHGKVGEKFKTEAKKCLVTMIVALKAELENANTTTEKLKKLCGLKYFPIGLIKLMVKHPNASDDVLKKLACIIVDKVTNEPAWIFMHYSFEEMPELAEMVNKEVIKELKNPNITEEQINGLDWLPCLSLESKAMMFAHHNCSFSVRDNAMYERNPQFVAAVLKRKEMPAEVRYYVLKDFKEWPKCNVTSIENVLTSLGWKLENLSMEMDMVTKVVEDIIKDPETSNSRLWNIALWAREGLKVEDFVDLMKHKNFDSHIFDLLEDSSFGDNEEECFKNVNFVLAEIDLYCRWKCAFENWSKIAAAINEHFGQWSCAEREMLIEKLHSYMANGGYSAWLVKRLWSMLGCLSNDNV